jgi:hypothetical protein
MSRWVFARALVLAAVAAGCTDDGLQSELDTEGPPRVTLVTLGQWDAEANTSVEAPIYCPPEDAGKVSVLCFDDSGNYAFDPAAAVFLAPADGLVRLAFSELLDPDRAEELVVVRGDDGQPLRDPYGNEVLRGTLERTQPVILTCDEQPVAYDGYYNPSGNHLSFPPGPSLVIRPVERIATGASCTIAVVQGETNPGFGVFDKAGNPVSATERGPFAFQVQPLTVTGASPGEVEGVVVGIEPVVTFNAPIDPASLGAGGAERVRLRAAADGAELAATLAVDGNAVKLTPASALTPGTPYEVVVYAGIADVAGGTLALDPDPTVVTTFTTSAGASASGH